MAERSAAPACLLLALVFLALPLGQPRAEETGSVVPRVGSHPDFGRIVFDFAAPVQYGVTRDGDRVLLRFETERTIGTAARPRNVRGFSGGAGQAQIMLVPAARLKVWRLANSVVVDVLDPTASPPASAGAAQPAAGSPAPASGPEPAIAPLARAIPATPTLPPALAAASRPIPADAPGGEPSQAGVVPEDGRAPSTAIERPLQPLSPLMPGPLALVARPLPAPAGVTGSAVAFPFDGTTGLAAFRCGDDLLLVFDERRPIDLDALRQDPVFGLASVQLLPGATLVRAHVAKGAELAVARSAEAWTIVVGAFGAVTRPIAPTIANRAVNFPAAAPGRIVAVTNPQSGGVLLVGTQRQPGQGILAPRQTGSFVLVPTWQGVVVEPLADDISLHAVADGFVLGAEPGGLPLSDPPPGEEAYADATALTRRYDFPPISDAALAARLAGEFDAIAALPPLGRFRPRRDAAETMLALGLAPEAYAMLQLAIEQDPRQADDPDTIGLQAIAALVSGRTGETDGLADPRLGGSDEMALWRGLQLAVAQEGAPAASSVFAATLPLVLSYPDCLRGRLLPLVAETLAANRSEAVRGLLARRKDDPALALARALLLEADGDTEGALAAYDGLSAASDPLTRVRAASRAVELRLAKGMIDARVAGDALERQVYAWRGDRRELALRLRTGELRRAAGAWRKSLAMLRETEVFWPDDRALVHARLEETFAALLSEHGIDRLSPLDLVALADENRDLLPSGEAGADMAAKLADRLNALDLPGRADPALSRLAEGSTGAVRAGFGSRLAALRLREGDSAGALAALAASLPGTEDAVPAAIVQQRTLVRGRAMAALGDVDGAMRLLGQLDTPEADEARASIGEDARRWPAAAAALAEFVRKTIPAEGALDDAQRRTMLRLAGATAQARDLAALEALRRNELKRMDGGPLGDMFGLLTAGPVQATSDLPRAGTEIVLARSVPSGLKAMQSRAPP